MDDVSHHVRRTVGDSGQSIGVILDSVAYIHTVRGNPTQINGVSDAPGCARLRSNRASYDGICRSLSTVRRGHDDHSDRATANARAWFT